MGEGVCVITCKRESVSMLVSVSEHSFVSECVCACMSVS